MCSNWLSRASDSCQGFCFIGLCGRMYILGPLKVDLGSVDLGCWLSRPGARFIPIPKGMGSSKIVHQHYRNSRSNKTSQVVLCCETEKNTHSCRTWAWCFEMKEPYKLWIYVWLLRHCSWTNLIKSNGRIKMPTTKKTSQYNTIYHNLMFRHDFAPGVSQLKLLGLEDAVRLSDPAAQHSKSPTNPNSIGRLPRWFT